MFHLHRYKCNVEKVLSGQRNYNIVSFHSFYTDYRPTHVALANLLSENIMVRGGFFYHCLHSFHVIL